jgi:hypothetical protein
MPQPGATMRADPPARRASEIACDAYPNRRFKSYQLGVVNTVRKQPARMER